MSGLVVERVGFSALVQDEGRHGFAAIGVGRSGAADGAALALANRLAANRPDAAGLEVLLGDCRLRAEGAVAVTVTGADVPVWVDDRPAGRNAPLRLRDGQGLRLGTAERGLRAYVALHGGVDVEPVLGSRSTDVLSGLGPPPLEAGMRLPAGGLVTEWPGVDAAAVGDPPDGRVTLAVLPGPREDSFASGAFDQLLEATWTVDAQSDRVGLRLEGPRLERASEDELPSEGLVTGAVQVPANGRPVLFGVDHPLTGGYPVLATVIEAHRDRIGQTRPGQSIRFVRG